MTKTEESTLNDIEEKRDILDFSDHNGLKDAEKAIIPALPSQTESTVGPAPLSRWRGIMLASMMSLTYWMMVSTEHQT